MKVITSRMSQTDQEYIQEIKEYFKKEKHLELTTTQVIRMALQNLYIDTIELENEVLEIKY